MNRKAILALVLLLLAAPLVLADSTSGTETESGTDTLSVGEEKKYSWNDLIEVKPGDRISPIYWGEGIKIQQIGPKTITYGELPEQESKILNEGESKTIPQDYVLHLCKAKTDSAKIIFTASIENTEQLCRLSVSNPFNKPDQSTSQNRERNPGEAPERVEVDLNNDGIADINDVELLSNNEDIAETMSTDYNCNGGIDSGDVQKLYAWISESTTIPNTCPEPSITLECPDTVEVTETRGETIECSITNTSNLGETQNYEWSSGEEIGNFETKGREAATYQIPENLTLSEITINYSRTDNFNKTARSQETISVNSGNREEPSTCTYYITGYVEGAEYDRNQRQRIYLRQQLFTSLARDQSFGWTATSPCNTTQTLTYKENGNIVKQTKIELPEQGTRVEKNITIQNQKQSDSLDNNEVSLNLEQHNVETGVRTRIEIQATQELAEQGYTLKIQGPETLTRSFNQNQASYTFTPQKTGEYTVKILPQVLGQNLPLIGNLLQGGALAKKTITVTSPETEKWKTYCTQQGYQSDIQGQINCIRKEIVPNYFQDTVGDNVEVAESLCQDLLGYSYNQETKACKP